MGCGYSKINISSRRGKLKIKAKVDPEYEDHNESFSPGKFKKANGKTPSPEIVKRNGVPLNTEESLASKRRIAHKIKPISGPMRPPLNRSESQEDFFKMLDDKIANGKDLECAGELDDSLTVTTGTENYKCRFEKCSRNVSTPNKDMREENECSDVASNNLEAPPTPSTKISPLSNQNLSAINHNEIDDKIIDSVSSIQNVDSPSHKRYSTDELSSPPGFSSDKPNVDLDNGQQTECECQEKSVNLNSSPVIRQTKLNNCEISNETGTVLDITDKMETITSSLHLSNGQVLS